jgi:parvulin-like peptidyl-prolyl isomerase
MTNMREKSAIILFTLLVLFVLSMMVGGLVGGANIVDILTGQHPNAIGMVNGREITGPEFERAFQYQMDTYRQQRGSSVPDDQIDFMRDRVWESLVQDILIEQAVGKKELNASDQEVLYLLRNNPPQFITSEPAFQNEQQQFDMNKYLAAIDNLIAANDPRATAQLLQIENAVRLTLPREKLGQRLEATVRVTDAEVKQEYLKNNQKAKVKYVFFDPTALSDDNYEPPQADLQAYYETHREDFKQPGKRQIEYAVLAVTPTAEDSAEQYDVANDLIERAKAGEEFEKLAEIYSEDVGTKEKGGDLGFFKKGAMVKEFEEAAFSAKTGEIIGPVKSRFGLHIIKVEERKGKGDNMEVKAKHILLKFEPSAQTRNRSRDNADRLAYEAETAPFDEIARKLAIEVQTSDFFPKGGGFVPGLGPNPRVSNAIFRSKVGTVGDVVQNRQGNYFVYKITGTREERVEALADVRDTIIAKLVSEYRMTKAGEKAESFCAELKTGTTLEEAAQSDSLEVKTTEAFARSGYVAGVGREGSFIGAAFGLDEPGAISEPVATTRGYYVVQLVEKTAFNADDFARQKEQVRSQLLERKKSQAFGLWYAQIREKSDIKDYRSRFY